MIKTTGMRLISLLLVVMMLVSAIPLQVFALEGKEEAADHQHMEINPFVESVLLKEVKSKMDEILEKYLGAKIMTQAEVEVAARKLGGNTLKTAWYEVQALGELAEPLTDAEIYFLQLYGSTTTFGYFYEVLSEIFGNPASILASATGNHTPVEGVTVNVSGATDNSMSGGAITVTAKGSAGILGFGASSKTATITIYNETENTAEISFDWTATSVYELKIDGTVYGGTSGSFSKVLGAGESFVVTITTDKNATENKLVMSNFALTVAKTESDVTFDFDSALGSVTVNGEAVSAGDTLTIPLAGAELKATAGSGVTFLGWIDVANNQIISKDATFTLKPADNMTVKAVFATTAPWFIVNGNSLYEGLDAAMDAVANVANKTVVLANNATLPAGDYTIPAGVTLLIPYNDANTVVTTVPPSTTGEVTPTAYRTLTMAAGANITVNGALSISGEQVAGGTRAGVPKGPLGFIKMESGSNITVNSDAFLYVWGYIMGSGTVTVKNGGTVYEDFQLANWRGGSATSGMAGNSYGVFPMSQYYIQNVEVPMTLEAGAIEYCYMSVSISMVGIQGAAVPFIGPKGMFNIVSGSITKDYIETTDRLDVTVDGEIAMQSLSISMKLGLLGTTTIDSSKYELPVNSNITVRVKDGGKINITQDIAMLPGSELIVEAGAECVLGKGYSIYIYDATEWAAGNFSYQTTKVNTLVYAPGKPANVPWHNADSDAVVHIAGTIDASQGYVYVTESGATITAEEGAVVMLQPGTQTVTYQATQADTSITYVSIPIKSVSLVEGEVGDGTYTYVDGAWVKSSHEHEYEVTETVDADCENAGHTTYTCIHCDDSYTVEIPAKGHTPGPDATCTEPQTCTVCGKVINPAGDHTPGAEATCTEPQICTVCGEELAPAKGHKPGDEADCTHAQTCTECGEELAPAKGHTPGEPATCTEDQTCTVCGIVLVEATGHSWQQIPAKAPSRTENGYEAYYACEVCGEIDGEITIIPALGVAYIKTYDDFIFNLTLLEEIAGQYVKENPGKDPIALVIKYIRTGVGHYNSASWGIMAGYEDADFANYVRRLEDTVNATVTDGNYVAVTGLKNLSEFELPNGDTVDFGHMFGAMDITYHNKGSENHADVAGWAGDLVDLVELADMAGVSGNLDAMIAEISEKHLGKIPSILGAPSMSQEDIYGDMDAYYIMYAVDTVAEEYTAGTLTEILINYFTEDLTMEQRAAFFMANRLETTGTRAHVRNAVYVEYASNKLIATLEGTREFKTNDLSNLRRAACYAFADYICKLAGDYVEKNDNPYYEVFNSSMSVLAPGITQESYLATSADGKQMVYYIATADITRDDVHVFANYHNAAPEEGWAMQRVMDQANAAQKKYGDPESPDYIPNYNVIVSTNADGYDMTTGEPGGLLVMNGKEWHGIGKSGFFGITKDGKAVIGTTDEYNEIYRGQLTDAVGGFGTMLIRDGEISVSRTDDYYTTRAPRTAVGITRTGKVVLMVLDGRQEPYSCGGSMQEIAQIMFEAGCVQAINLDGGGSTTFVARQQGDEELSILNSPSDGTARSVSTSLMMVSTAPSSTAFDHANLISAYNYSTIGTPVEITPVGISATGNVTELPEGYTWAVSNESWATITEDGVFTGLRNGSVEVYLMLDGDIIGRKTMNVVVPESVYFAKKTVDAVYGSTIQLPIAALYEGKQVAINVNDVKLELDIAKAGTVDGFAFTAAEDSGVKVVKITATLVADSAVSGTVTVNLYKQGENSFDFDKATGGDRLLAWDRVVSNATTSDGMSYVVIEPDQDMVTSYTFAMDMTQIPIPTQLSDLVYMLPGADMADASAWNFLLQLAERVSTLTEVTPVLRFDPNVDVDYSELTIVTEYFTLRSAEFDEATNTLTLKLNWIDQTAAINPATANPLCLVSGIKLTPKDDANWDANKRLNLVHSGEISYKIYLRANALYSFAQKPENQAIFGLLPFVNPDLPSETGAYFSNVYKEFEDSYTLVNALKNGWYPEDGGFAYYIQGVKLSGGVKEVEGYYYYFDDNGINIGQNKYTGIFFEPSDGAYYYAKNGTLEGDWQSIDGSWYFFDRTTLKAVSGTRKIGGITFEFEGNGKLKSGVWVNVVTGWRYYYGPSYYLSRWQNIDGEWYYFRDGYPVTGLAEVFDKDLNYISKWYNFGEDGIARELEYDGFYEIGGELYYIVDGIHLVGLHKIDGDYYFFTYAGPAVRGMSHYAWETHCDLPCGTYAFGRDGKMVNGLAEMEDGIYYYVNGKIDWTAAGLRKIGDDYYFINTAGKCVTGAYYAWETFCDLPCGNYEFGADGKMLQGIVEKADGHYYYVNGKIDWTLAGLHKVGDDYYFINTAGKCVTGAYYAWETFCDLPCGNYEFGADGKMLQGIVEKADGYYFYVNGRIDWTAAGLHKIGDDYYFVNTAGKCVTGIYYAWETFCDLPCSEYEFGADGKMLHGFVEKEDGIYVYVNGKPGSANPGLAKIGDDYYFINSAGKIVTGTYYAWATNCDLPIGTYEFDEQGRMLNGFVNRADGIYYYEYGKLAASGLTKIGDDYYFINSAGKVVTGTYYAWETNCDLPIGTYEFDEQGRMLNGFVTKADGLYYYVNGKVGTVGVNYIDGYYYFLNTQGKLVTNQVFYVWETNGLIMEAYYVFNELGQIVRLA